MMKIKFLITLFLVLIIFSCEKENSDNTLVRKSFKYEAFSSNLSESVSHIYFIDDKIGFASGYGKIFKTIDGGVIWESDSITDIPFYSIYFVTGDLGFAVGGKSSYGGTGCTIPGSFIYKTVNSGETWNKLHTPCKWSELNSVSFINENIGFVIGLGLQIKTTNGGETWEQFEFEYKGLMTKITFIDSQTGFSAGLFGNIFKTTNQGESWLHTNNESDGHVYDLCFVNCNIGYAGGQKEIVKTIDGGDTWDILTNSPQEIYFLHFSDENNGIAIGKGHYTGGSWGEWTKAIFRTANGGVTWEKEDNIEFGYSTSFYNRNNGYSIVPNKTFKISYK